MRLLFLGDLVGRSGRVAVVEALPGLRERYRADFVVVNGENAAGGFGITEPILTELLDAGADVVTTGNHVFDQRETLVFIERADRLLRPINYPPGTPGRGAGLYKAANGADVLASAVVGTHTHVPTADEQILERGTAYISDAGMCGDFDSVLGMDKEEPLQRFLTKVPNARFQPALGEATICGVGIEIDDQTGLARAIAPIRLGGSLSQTEPAFWLPEV